MRPRLPTAALSVTINHVAAVVIPVGFLMGAVVARGSFALAAFVSYDPAVG
ncbi:MAG: hypothetical protein ACOC3D_11115 [Pseudomonadota bacterium]